MLFAAGAVQVEQIAQKKWPGWVKYALPTCIAPGGSLEAMKESYKDVLQVDIFKDEYCMPYENDQPIFICKGRYRPLKDDWADFKHYE